MGNALICFKSAHTIQQDSHIFMGGNEKNGVKLVENLIEKSELCRATNTLIGAGDDVPTTTNEGDTTTSSNNDKFTSPNSSSNYKNQQKSNFNRKLSHKNESIQLKQTLMSTSSSSSTTATAATTKTIKETEKEKKQKSFSASLVYKSVPPRHMGLHIIPKTVNTSNLDEKYSTNPLALLNQQHQHSNCLSMKHNSTITPSAISQCTTTATTTSTNSVSLHSYRAFLSHNTTAQRDYIRQQTERVLRGIENKYNCIIDICPDEQLMNCRLGHVLYIESYSVNSVLAAKSALPKIITDNLITSMESMVMEREEKKQELCRAAAAAAENAINKNDQQQQQQPMKIQRCSCMDLL